MLFTLVIPIGYHKITNGYHKGHKKSKKRKKTSILKSEVGKDKIALYNVMSKDTIKFPICF